MTTNGINASELLGTIIVGGIATKMADTMFNKQPEVQQKMRYGKTKMQHHVHRGKTNLQHHVHHETTKMQRKIVTKGADRPF